LPAIQLPRLPKLRRRKANPEARMSLRDHLRELRRRLIWAGLAITVGTVIGWFLYDPLLQALQTPLNRIGAEHGTLVKLNFSDVASPFNLKLKLSFYLGVVVASPIWIYQTWAFIVPGLTRKEKRYTVGFVGTAIPLFLAGIGLAWLVLPNAMEFFSSLTPTGSSQLIDADTYLTFVTRVMLAFGLAFITPILLVALNLAGLLPANTLARGWRIAVFACFLFAAIASPSPDAGSMIALALPMVGLYALAVAIAWTNDRRRARRDQRELRDLPDDQASEI
jgi:sec-independent protein translocase protein TatC